MTKDSCHGVVSRLLPAGECGVEYAVYLSAVSVPVWSASTSKTPLSSYTTLVDMVLCP